jgi:glycosyltransferase involved in cell wall biosynthesis
LDLTEALVKRKHKVVVLTYIPLTTDSNAKLYEKSKNLKIFRTPYIRGLFYKLIKSPVLEFLYLLPGLFVATPILLLTQEIDVIHSHGLVAGFVCVFWGKIFKKKTIVTTHSIYNFPKSGLYKNFTKLIFSLSDKVLCLSNQSVKEVINLGINRAKVERFVYWIDTAKFKPSKTNLKRELGLVNNFVVLFVGRLIKEKGLIPLLESAKKFPEKVCLLIAGDGPLRERVETTSRDVDNVRYLGKLDSEELVDFYNTADVLIVPSTSEEGFGRIILESLSCGTPVIGTNRGAVPEAIDDTVGLIVDPKVNNIVNAIKTLHTKPQLLKKFQQNARKFALKRYSEKNVGLILKHYQ